MILNKFKHVILFITTFVFLFEQNAVAQFSGFGQQPQSQFGSGVMAGQWSCPYVNKTSKAAVSVSDDEKAKRKKIVELKAKLKTEVSKKESAEKKYEKLKEKIQKYFDDSVVEFVIDTHVEGLKNCDTYVTAHPKCNPQPAQAPVVATVSQTIDASKPADQQAPVAATVAPVQAVVIMSKVDKEFCDNLTPVPALLANKWNTKDSTGKGAYCIGSGKANAGSVNSSICNDEKLRPTDTKRRTYNVSECSRAVSEYRKKRMESASAADKEELINEQIDDVTAELEDATADRQEREKERAAKKTETDCEDCDNVSRAGGAQLPERNLGSTLLNVGAGIGLMYFGKKSEEANNLSQANAGLPSNSSYGYPFYVAGMAGVVNGLVGPGAYGCSGGYNGAGFPNGSGGGWNMGGAQNGAYGPAGAQGGAFGYQQNQFGSPMLGGAFNPGFNVGGNMNGPNGGYNIGGQMNFPTNGNMAMCVTFPCNVNSGGNNQSNPFGNSPYGNSQFQQQGWPVANGQFQMGSQFSGQYQMQMLQQQQQMQQQQYQQQMQYYNQQVQQQQQQMQQQYQRQQQEYQVRMQMAQLNAQLAQLQQQSYYSTGNNGFNASGGFNLGSNFNFGFNAGTGNNTQYNTGYNNGSPFTNVGGNTNGTINNNNNNGGGTVRGR